MAAAIGVFAVFLVASKPWTFAPVLICIMLAFANPAIGRLRPERFFWYGIAIFASVTSAVAAHRSPAEKSVQLVCPGR